MQEKEKDISKTPNGAAADKGDFPAAAPTTNGYFRSEAKKITSLYYLLWQINGIE